MKWLEIISMRTAGPFEKGAREYMQKFCSEFNRRNLSEASFYVHDSIPGDLALVITSHIKEGKIKETELGNYMIEELKQFGLVDYNCWLWVERQ